MKFLTLICIFLAVVIAAAQETVTTKKLLMECPEKQPSDSPVCGDEFTCTYGEETCCGKTYDSMECTCYKNQQIMCMYTEACMEMRDCDTKEEADDFERRRK